MWITKRDLTAEQYGMQCSLPTAGLPEFDYTPFVRERDKDIKNSARRTMYYATHGSKRRVHGFTYLVPKSI
jgi:hypothetical protein